MKIFLTEKIRQLDSETIRIEGIRSYELMDRAADAIYKKLRLSFTKNDRILVIAGPGNNGGDALAVAGLLINSGHKVCTLLCNFRKDLSEDALLQYDRLKKTTGAVISNPLSVKDINLSDSFDVIIDGLFGSGLNRPLEGEFAEIVNWINNQHVTVVSIDIPSGLFGENNSENPGPVVISDYVIGLQFPKLAFLMPENHKYIKKWDTADIGLNQEAIENCETGFYMSNTSFANSILHIRNKFSHKGDFGRGLLISGSKGMAGAAVLAAKGAIRSGIGLLTLRVPDDIYTIVQTSVPEAMASTYQNDLFWDETISGKSWTAAGIGPGLGLSENKKDSLKRLLCSGIEKIVLDADAINIIAEDNTLLELLHKGCIMTPHPGEFERLTGQKYSSGYERLEAAIEFAVKHSVNLVLKGAYTACINYNGICRFNSSGNPGMATGGSGDVLTGIILSLLCQGYSCEEASVLGTYLHGLSADLSLQKQSQESLIAGDIPNHLGKAFNIIRNYEIKLHKI
jgi:NAD(P)H-hydrate epimerase